MKPNGVLGYGTLVQAWTWKKLPNQLKSIEPLHGMVTSAEIAVILTVMDVVRGGER